MKTKKMSVNVDENQIRKMMIAQFAAEMREKGYDVVFSNKTNKIVSVRQRKNDIIEHFCKKIKKQIKKRYNLDIDFTNNHNLFRIAFQDRKPINSIRTAITDCKKSRTEKTIQHKFESLKAQLKRRYRIDIDFNDDYSLNKISFIDHIDDNDRPKNINVIVHQEKHQIAA